MEIISQLLTLFIPASLVLYGMYLLADRFLSKYADDNKALQQNKVLETTLPLRLQAYERMVLFLERITPANLLVRTMPSAIQVADFHERLLHEIREEYHHNLAQQLYISPEVWTTITEAKESVITLINQAAAGVPLDAPAIQLSKQVLEASVLNQVQPTTAALNQLKQEARNLWNPS